ncbi:NADPH:quinone oxidoreductase family protein [Deinococcus deserti]|uniref:Putative NADPH:quinone reductase (Quinone oxidoreductase) n=1 Tax=Deinococcus deserti (strain DSM 17065 / CIP 109153 / LMG 22923 / VCD115) TaxID=546414 RepID=C1D390_DEIDV|nr:NADPH:quinone oxidoreductase family protein [Deinococcus deserti]ACO47879.1 putative NADPH:quinone reductase (Quinone oxidoreductase) [Deinococcus deserti VCD115]
MRAVICQTFDQPETLTVQTLPDPQPGPGEVVIAVEAAGVNYPDALMVMGQYQVRPPLPFTPGAEAAGRISAVGEGVTGLQVGQRVAAFTGTGAFASHLKADARAVMPLPDALPLDVAATLPLAYGTSLHALIQRGALQPGETLLVLGAAGGVGLAAVMIGKALGARVIAGVSTPEKGDVARQHGADEVIEYSTEDLRERLKSLTGGQGPDVIFDPVGDRYAEAAFRSIAWGGRYLVIGFAGGEIPRLPLNLPLLKGASIVGVFWGEFARRDPQGNTRNLSRLAAWIAQGEVRPLVSERYPLERTGEALRALLDRRVTGKVVLTP